MKLFLIPLLITFQFQLLAQVMENATEAFQRAKITRVPILLVFSGSDWCQPCKRFQADILDKDAFTEFSEKDLVVLKADFPQRKKQDSERIRQNEDLAERFNPEGIFPKMLLLDADGNLIDTIEYAYEDVTTFVGKVQRHFQKKSELKEYKKRASLMGSFFEFIIVDSSSRELQAAELLDQSIEIVDRIEHIISEWIDTSEVSRLNKLAGKKMLQVSPELYELIRRSKAMSDLTQGAFDISFVPLNSIWTFDGGQHPLPDSAAIKRILHLVGYQKILLLSDNKVFLSQEGMSIGFGGIGQGYAVDRVKEFFLKSGVKNFLINSSGDIYAHGRTAEGSPWKVGVANPFDKNKIILWLDAMNTSVVTSGNYEKYFEYNGSRYGHIVDPRNGYPIREIASVTVISPSTEMSDALATALFILGPDASIHLINQLPDTHCIIVDRKGIIYVSKELTEHAK